jgi:undecaprenyl-diphosphatase
MSKPILSRILLDPFHAFEVRAVFVIFAFFCAILGLVLSLDFFRSGATLEFDQSVLLAMREPHDLADPRGRSWLEELGRDFTALGGIPVLTFFTLAVVGFLAFTHHKTLATIFFVTTLMAMLLSFSLKATLDRARPDLVPHRTQVHTASFPSGHAMHAAATYLTLGGLLARFQQRRRLQIFVVAVAAITTLLVGLSRVYLGVHWPTDVLGGWALGSACALLTLMLARALIAPSAVADEVFVDDAI